MSTIHDGYVLVIAKWHPRAVGRGYVREHVLVVERAIGRYLPNDAVVHHVNEVRTDNRPENLVVLQDRMEHNELHRRLRVLRAGGNPWTQRLCTTCQTPKDSGELRHASGYYSTCRSCAVNAKRTRRINAGAIPRFARRTFISAVALVTMACGGKVQPRQIAVERLTTIHPYYGINDAYHGPLPPDIVQHYVGYGGELTIRTPQVSKDGLNQFLLSVVTLPVRTIALIEDNRLDLPVDFAGFASLAAIENGNELELPPKRLSPLRYGTSQSLMAQAERAKGFTGDIITGGVYALTDGEDGTKRAIRLAIAQCGPNCNVIGVHLYTITDDDVEFLNSLDRDIAITETGSPTGCGTAKWQEQADYVVALQQQALRIRRLKYFLIYQRPSGPSCSNLDTFGIQATTATWKPLDDLLGQWVRGR